LNRFNDIERATNAKFVVEQQQRDQAKVRKEYDLAWEHKVRYINLYCTV